MLDLGESDTQLGQSVLEAVERRGGARVHDRRLGTVDPISRDRPMKTEMYEVDRRNAHERSVEWGRWKGIGLPFLHGNEIARWAPQKDLPRACDALIRVFELLLPLRQPPDCPRNREEYGEHLHGKTQRLVYEA